MTACWLPVAKAERIFAITDQSVSSPTSSIYDRRLWELDTSDLVPSPLGSPAVSRNVGTITGLSGVLNCIDFRPADGGLYAASLVASSPDSVQLYRIDSTSFVAQPLGTPIHSPIPLSLSSSRLSMDIDPVSDVVHITDRDGLLLLVDPDDGRSISTHVNIGYVPGDTNFGVSPLLREVGFDRQPGRESFGTMFGYDARAGTLVRIGDVNGTPNGAESGELHSLGTVRQPGVHTGFDISAATGLAYMYVQNAAGPNGSLFSVDLEAGTTSLLGPTFHSIRGFNDIAVPIPEPTCQALFACAGIGAFGRRRRGN